MIEYVIVKCPYCNYHWRSKKVTVEDVKKDKKSAISALKSCTRCKKRFDVPWGKKPTLWVEKHENYRALSKALDDYNKKT